MSRDGHLIQDTSLNDAFEQAVFILHSLCFSQKRDFEGQEEAGAFLNCVDYIAQFGDYSTQKLFVFILYASVECMKAEPNSNSVAADNLHLFELRFRQSCSPLFDRLDSFLPEEQAESASTSVTSVKYMR